MNSFSQDDAVVEAVLQNFQHELRSLHGGWISRALMGEPPVEGFARQMSKVDERGRLSGSVRGLWRITGDQINALPATFAVPPVARISGMYYDRGTFDFVLAVDGKSVIVGWQVGPRFGRGIRYCVVVGDSGQTTLRSVELLWKS